ncbi:MAG: hypothetical protein ABIA47_04055 [bacterium]
MPRLHEGHCGRRQGEEVMRTHKIALLVVLLSALAGMAVAGDPLGALAGIASSGQASKSDLSQLRAAAWAGQARDPLEPMVDWRGVIDPSICRVGAPPPSWWQVEGVYRLEVHNKTNQAVRLEVDRQVVDVADSIYSGRDQLPMMALVQTASGVRRHTVLRPGAVCSGVLTYKGVPDRNTRWEVEAVTLGYHGGVDKWLDIGQVFLFTAPLYESKRSRKMMVYHRNQRKSIIHVESGDF